MSGVDVTRRSPQHRARKGPVVHVPADGAVHRAHLAPALRAGPAGEPWARAHRSAWSATSPASATPVLGEDAGGRGDPRPARARSGGRPARGRAIPLGTGRPLPGGPGAGRGTQRDAARAPCRRASTPTRPRSSAKRCGGCVSEAWHPCSGWSSTTWSSCWACRIASPCSTSGTRLIAEGISTRSTTSSLAQAANSGVPGGATRGPVREHLREHLREPLRLYCATLLQITDVEVAYGEALWLSWVCRSRWRGGLGHGDPRRRPARASRRWRRLSPASCTRARGASCSTATTSAGKVVAHHRQEWGSPTCRVCNLFPRTSR